MMKTIVRKIGLVAHDAMKKDMIEWVLWNSERLIGHKFYCTGTTGTLIKKALEEKHPETEWDITILKSGPLGGDQQMGSRIVAGVENIVFCCNRSTADHIISSPLFLDPTYKRIHPDYTNYTQRFENKEIVSEAVERVKKRMSRNENNMIE